MVTPDHISALMVEALLELKASRLRKAAVFAELGRDVSRLREDAALLEMMAGAWIETGPRQRAAADELEL